MRSVVVSLLVLLTVAAVPCCIGVAPAAERSSGLRIAGMHRIRDQGVRERRCWRVDSAAGWRELVAQLSVSPAMLPDWNDFGAATVVVLTTGPGIADADPEILLVNEEDVDVVTVVQQVAPGAALAPALLLRMPRRDVGLAVVLREVNGSEPLRETTVATFAAGR